MDLDSSILWQHELVTEDYKLKAFAVANNPFHGEFSSRHQHTLLLNDRDYHDLSDISEPREFFSSNTGKPVQVDLDRIKKYITLLVYEKVPDTS